MYFCEIFFFFYLKVREINYDNSILKRLECIATKLPAGKHISVGIATKQCAANANTKI